MWTAISSRVGGSIENTVAEQFGVLGGDEGLDTDAGAPEADELDADDVCRGRPGRRARSGRQSRISSLVPVAMIRPSWMSVR